MSLTDISQGKYCFSLRIIISDYTRIIPNKMQKRILLDLSLTITIRTAIEYLLEPDLILEHTVYCQFLKICCNESKIFFCDQGRTNMKTNQASATSLPKQLFAASKIVGIPKAKIPEAISLPNPKSEKAGKQNRLYYHGWWSVFIKNDIEPTLSFKLGA